MKDAVCLDTVLVMVKPMSDFEDESRIMFRAIETLRQDVKALEVSQSESLRRISNDIQTLRDELGNLNNVSNKPLNQRRKRGGSLEKLAIILPFLGLLLGRVIN